MSSSITNSRRIAKNTIFLYVRMLFSMLVSLYTARVILNTLGVSDYGLFNVVGGIISALTVLRAIISTGTQRFLTFEMGRGSDTERLTSVFTTSLTTFLMVDGVIFVLGETIGFWFVNNYLNIPIGREFAANIVYQVSILSMLATTVQVPYTAALISHERMDIYGYIGVGEPLLRLGLVSLLPFLPGDKLIIFSIITIILAGGVSLVYLIVCPKLFEECRFRLKIDKPLFKSMIGFTIWNMLETISNMLQEQGLDILLNLFFGTIVNASRAVARQVYHAIHGFASNFLVAMFPQITKTYAAREYSDFYNLMIRGAKFSYIIMALLMVPLFLNIDYILEIWLKNPPDGTTIFCKLILLAELVRIISEPLYTGIQATGEIKKYQIWTSSITLLFLPVCYILFMMGFPAYICFCASIVNSLVIDTFRIVFLSKLTDFPVRRYIKIILLNCFGVTFLAYIPLFYLNKMLTTGVINLIVITVFAFLWMGFVFFLLTITTEERHYIKNIVLSKLNMK